MVIRGDAMEGQLKVGACVTVHSISPVSDNPECRRYVSDPRELDLQ